VAITVGSVYVDILPSTEKFAGEAGSQLDPVIKAIGKKIAEELGKAIGKGVSDGVEEGVGEADTGNEAAKQGTKTGGKFANSFKRTLEAALKNLPEIKLDADTKPALRNVAALREQINKLSASVDVDVDPKKALLGLEKLQRELEFILRSSDVEIDVKVDAAAALKDVVKLREEIARSLDRSSADAGKFARDLNAKISAAIKSLPNIEIRANATGAELTLRTIREQLATLSGKRIAIDITVNDAVSQAEAQLARLKALLERDNLELSIRVNAEAAAAELEAFIRSAQGLDEIDVDIKPNFGAFNADLKTKLAAIAASIRPIDIELTTGPAQVKIEEIRREIASISGRIGVDMDTGAALARIKILQAELTLLTRRRTIDIDVKADVKAAVAELAALQAAAAAAGSTANGHFSRMQLILAAVVALFPLIAAAIIALPGLLAAVVAPVGAIALGIEGIKAAAQPLVPLFKDLQTQISAAFQNGLNPTINGLATLMAGLSSKILDTAHATISVANGVTQVAASGANLKGIQTNFDLINKAILASGPALETLTTNLITLVGIGASGLVAFAGQMQQVGDAWKGVIDRLNETGIGKAAVEGLFSVLTSLLGLLAPLTELGSELAAGFGPALAGAVQVVGFAFQQLASFLSLFPTQVTGVIAVVGTLIGVLGILGKLPASIAGQFATMRIAMLFLADASLVSVAGLGALATGLKGLGVAMAGLLFNPLVLTIAAVTTALILLSNAQNDASEAAAKHQQFISGLAQQLSSTNGVITDSTKAWVANSEGYSTVAEGAKLAGINLADLGDALTGNTGKLEAIRAKLAETVIANRTWLGVLGGNTDAVNISSQALNENGVKAQEALLALNGMADGLEAAKVKSQDLADTLRKQGTSLVDGVASAKSYSDSLDKIKDAMSTTADRADALRNALILLSGGQLSLLEANSQYAKDLKALGDAFTGVSDQIKKGGQSFTNTAGRINVGTEAGQKFADAFSKVFTSMTNAASAAFTAAGGVDNLTTSVPAAVQKVQELRDIFVKQAIATGKSTEEANKLADSLGLMPKVAEILFSLKGMPAVQEELLRLQDDLQLLSKDHPITVNALTDEAAKALDALGFKLEKIPGTTQTIISIEDAAAKQKYADFIREITTPAAGPAKLPTDLDISKISPALAGIVDQISKPTPTGPATIPTDLDISKIQPALGGIVDQITKPPAPPAMPAELDPAKVPAQTAAIQQTVLGTVATMPVNIIKGSGWDADIIAIRDSILLTVGNLPINPIKGSGWDADLILIRDSVLLTVATMPINPIKGSGWDADLALIKASVGLSIPFAQLPIDVIKSINFDAQLAAIKLLITTPIPPFPAIPVDAVKSINFDAQLAAIMALITIPAAPVAIPIDLTVTAATTTLNNFLNVIRGTIVAFKVDCSTALAVDRLFKFWDSLAKVVAVFGVDADVSAAINTVNALVQAISQMVVPITVVAVFGGFMGGIAGGAQGGVVSGAQNQAGGGTTDPGGASSLTGGSSFGSNPPLGGSGAHFNPDADLDTGNVQDIRNAIGRLVMHASGSIDSLTPMKKIAAVVPPNTWRVVGDRMTDDEAFIPINNSQRSQSILALTAQRMGFGVTPMADGAVQTQQVGAMAPMAAQGTSATFEGSTTTRGPGGDTYNFNIATQGADAYELADEALFRLRYSKVGGIYSGRR
jgi:hypothetical protein